MESLKAGCQRAFALAATADLVHRRRSRAITPAVSTLAAPTNALTRPTALESLTAIQATARLGDVSALRHRLRIACHPRKLPRIATVANSTPFPLDGIPKAILVISLGGCFLPLWPRFAVRVGTTSMMMGSTWQNGSKGSATLGRHTSRRWSTIRLRERLLANRVALFVIHGR